MLQGRPDFRGGPAITTTEISNRQYTSVDLAVDPTGNFQDLEPLRDELRDMRARFQIVPAGSLFVSFRGDTLEFEARDGTAARPMGLGTFEALMGRTFGDEPEELSLDEIADELDALCSDPTLVATFPALGGLCPAGPIEDVLGSLRRLFRRLEVNWRPDRDGGAELFWSPPEAGDPESTAALTMRFPMPADTTPSPVLVHGPASVDLRGLVVDLRLQAVPCGIPACAATGPTMTPPACDVPAGQPLQQDYLGVGTGNVAPLPTGVNVTARLTLEQIDFRIIKQPACDFFLPPPACTAGVIALNRLAPDLIRDAVQPFLDSATGTLSQLFAGLPLITPNPVVNVNASDGSPGLPGVPLGANVVPGAAPPPIFGAPAVADNTTIGAFARGFAIPAAPAGFPMNFPAVPELTRVADNVTAFTVESRRIFTQPLADANPNARITGVTQPFGPGTASFNFMIDSDGDFLDDGFGGADTCPNTPNPDVDGDGCGEPGGDSDSDGHDDVCDLCPGFPNPDNNVDFDMDGFAAPCDCDQDGDTCPDSLTEPFGGPGGGACTSLGPGSTLDEEPSRPSPTRCPPLLPSCMQLDVDGDGDVDGYDLDGDGLISHCDEDDDGDGVLDPSDNCPERFNPEQRDRDGDGVGDVCDPCVGCLVPSPPSDGVDTALGPPNPGAAGPGLCIKGGGPAVGDCFAIPNPNPFCMWDDSCSGEPDRIAFADPAGGAFRVVSAEQIDGLAGLGPAMQPIPDLDGDGIEELAIGSPLFDNCHTVVSGETNCPGGARAGPACDTTLNEQQVCAQNSGEVIAISTAETNVLWRETRFSEDAELGRSMLRLGDLLLVGAPGLKDATGRRTGGVVVFDVRSEPRVVRTLHGPVADEGFGTSLAHGFDLDLDGRGDIVVGAPLADTAAGTDAGRAYLVTQKGDVLAQYDGPLAGARLGETISSILPRPKFVAASGVAIGAPEADAGAGMVAFFHWSGPLKWTLLGDPGERLGTSLAPAADFDIDGIEEIAVGGPGADGGRGRVRIVTPFGTVVQHIQLDEGFGFGFLVNTPGDLDDDGDPDLLVTMADRAGTGDPYPGAYIGFSGIGGQRFPTEPF